MESVIFNSSGRLAEQFEEIEDLKEDIKHASAMITGKERMLAGLRNRRAVQTDLQGKISQANIRLAELKAKMKAATKGAIAMKTDLSAKEI